MTRYLLGSGYGAEMLSIFLVCAKKQPGEILGSVEKAN